MSPCEAALHEAETRLAKATAPIARELGKANVLFRKQDLENERHYFRSAASELRKMAEEYRRLANGARANHRLYEARMYEDKASTLEEGAERLLGG